MRPYQLAAVAACRERLASPSGRAIIAMPPGTGVVRTAVAILAEVDAPVSLVLAHRRDQLQMAVHQLKDAMPDAHVSVIDDAIRPPLRTKVLVATVACARLLVANGHLRLDDLGLVVLHQCHRSVGPLLHEYQGRLLGLTDLPDRETLGRMGVSEPAFAYSFADAVRDGYLVPFRREPLAELPNIEADWLVRPFDLDGLDALETNFNRRWFLTPNLAQRVALDLVEHLGRDAQGLPPKTVVVVPDRSAAELAANVLNQTFAVPGIAACITSGTTQPWAMSQRFRSDSLPRFAVIVDQHEAVSIPEVHAIVLLRPVRSLRLCHSLLCIGARPAPDKTSFTVFDYTNTLELFGRWFED